MASLADVAGLLDVLKAHQMTTMLNQDVYDESRACSFLLILCSAYGLTKLRCGLRPHLGTVDDHGGFCIVAY